jgi:hypothetical protein
MVHRKTLSVSQLVPVRSGSFSSGLWCPVRGSEETWCLRKFGRPLNTKRWKHRVPSKRREPITSWRNVTPQKKGMLNHTVVNTSKLTMTGEEILKGSHFDVTRHWIDMLWKKPRKVAKRLNQDGRPCDRVLNTGLSIRRRPDSHSTVKFGLKMLQKEHL